MRARTAALLLATSLIFIGAGCAETATTTDTSTKDSGTTADATITVNDMAKDAAAAVAPVIDATWQKYTNAALNFTFDWPTKGLYAPRWEVKFLADADVKDGCYAPEGMTTSAFKAGDKEFCHAASAEEAAMSTDFYVTKVGEKYVLLSFTKDSEGMGKDFSWKDYRKNLDQIVATFKAEK